MVEVLEKSDYIPEDADGVELAPKETVGQFKEKFFGDKEFEANSGVDWLVTANFKEGILHDMLVERDNMESEERKEKVDKIINKLESAYPGPSFKNADFEAFIDELEKEIPQINIEGYLASFENDRDDLGKTMDEYNTGLDEMFKFEPKKVAEAAKENAKIHYKLVSDAYKEFQKKEVSSENVEEFELEMGVYERRHDFMKREVDRYMESVKTLYDEDYFKNILDEVPEDGSYAKAALDEVVAGVAEYVKKEDLKEKLSIGVVNKFFEAAEHKVLVAHVADVLKLKEKGVDFDDFKDLLEKYSLGVAEGVSEKERELINEMMDNEKLRSLLKFNVIGSADAAQFRKLPKEGSEIHKAAERLYKNIDYFPEAAEYADDLANLIEDISDVAGYFDRNPEARERYFRSAGLANMILAYRRLENLVGPDLDLEKMEEWELHLRVNDVETGDKFRFAQVRLKKRKEARRKMEPIPMGEKPEEKEKEKEEDLEDLELEWGLDKIDEEKIKEYQTNTNNTDIIKYLSASSQNDYIDSILAMKNISERDVILRSIRSIDRDEHLMTDSNKILVYRALGEEEKLDVEKVGFVGNKKVPLVEEAWSNDDKFGLVRSAEHAPYPSWNKDSDELEKAEREAFNELHDDKTTMYKTNKDAVRYLMDVRENGERREDAARYVRVHIIPDAADSAKPKYEEFAYDILADNVVKKEAAIDAAGDDVSEATAESMKNTLSELVFLGSEKSLKRFDEIMDDWKEKSGKAKYLMSAFREIVKRKPKMFKDKYKKVAESIYSSGNAKMHLEVLEALGADKATKLLSMDTPDGYGSSSGSIIGSETDCMSFYFKKIQYTLEGLNPTSHVAFTSDGVVYKDREKNDNNAEYGDFSLESLHSRDQKRVIRNLGFELSDIEAYLEDHESLIPNWAE